MMLTSWSPTDGRDGSTLVKSGEGRWLQSTSNVRVVRS